VHILKGEVDIKRVQLADLDLSRLRNWFGELKRPLAFGIGAVLLTGIITFFMPNYYKSEARILPVESKGMGGSLGNLAAAAATFGVVVPGGEGTDNNFVDIINSRWMRENLLGTEFQYKSRSWRFGKEVDTRQTLYKYIHPKNIDRGVQKISKIVHVSRDLKTKVLTITAETRYPELSQQIVIRASSLLEKFIKEKGRTRGGYKAEFARDRLAEARTDMAKAETTFRDFLENNRNYQVSQDPVVKLTGARLEAELRLRQQLVITLSVNQEQALMEEKDDIPIVSFLDPANYPIDKSKPSRLIIVVISFVFAAGGYLGWMKRNWIKARLMDDCPLPANSNPAVLEYFGEDG
jgi:uncharacterized protein involved in exopolysaccharide biosynthesis